MVLTVQDVIHVRSKFRVGVGTDISDDDLNTLQTMAETRLSRIIGNRSFSTDEMTEMTALIVLDYLQNRPGHGAIVAESVTDSSWRNKGVATTSQWLDEVYSKISEYDTNNNSYSASDCVAYRDDSHIDGVIDGSYESFRGGHSGLF